MVHMHRMPVNPCVLSESALCPVSRLNDLRRDVYFSLKPLQDEAFCWANRAIKCVHATLPPKPV